MGRGCRQGSIVSHRKAWKLVSLKAREGRTMTDDPGLPASDTESVVLLPWVHGGLESSAYAQCQALALRCGWKADVVYRRSWPSRRNRPLALRWGRDRHLIELV